MALQILPLAIIQIVLLNSSLVLDVLPFLLLLFTAILMAVSVAQFVLLAIMVIIPITMLSGGMGTIKSQPDTVQNLTTLRPSHYSPAFCSLPPVLHCFAARWTCRRHVQKNPRHAVAIGR